MPFGIKMLRTILQICFGIAPQTVTLCTDFRLHLHLTNTEIQELLTEITICTGLRFPPDAAEHLTNVFDLLIHITLRLHEDCDTTQYFGSIPERLVNQDWTCNSILVDYTATHLN